MIEHTEQNKEIDDIRYLRKCWWTATEERNGRNIKDTTRNGYNNREINHTANTDNKNKTNKESIVETQESELVEKETRIVNIQKSH